jgi:two-component system, OmpR family, sensor histidine kinase ArlS
MISLKQRFTFYFSILFSVILAIVLVIVFSIFAQYRKIEFKLRLEEKALSTVELLTELKVPEIKVLDIISENSVDKLYNDKILIFGADKKLIYSNIGGPATIMSASDFQLLKSNGSFYSSENEIDKYGLLYKSKENKEFYILVKAEDRYGHRHLLFLRYLLLGAFFIGTISVVILAQSLSGRILLPLKQIQQRITNISEKKLHIRLEEKRNNDEMDKLAQAFNEMMDRIDTSYKQQKEFTDNASHELRTPVTRIIMQIQNLIKRESHSENTLQYLNSIMADSNQIADTISSLLLLSRIDSGNISGFFPPCRMDEIIFEAIQSVSATYHDVRILFNIENNSENEIDIEIKGDTNLLKIVFINLFRNAYLYSSDKLINVMLIQESDRLKVLMINEGEVISTEDRPRLFQAFARGKNSRNIPGTGLGLRITERILNYHHATIQYEALSAQTNCFTISFKFN